jgi:hypothetical protein
LEIGGRSIGTAHMVRNCWYFLKRRIAVALISFRGEE